MNLSWYVIRGSGLVAFGLLTASMVWGLLISGKTLGRSVKAKGLQWLHESLGLAALLATVVHLIALSVDGFIGFSWLDLLVPGVSEWKPFAVTLGIVAFWTITVVSLSFYVKRWIGQSAWRSIHYLSFGAFIAAGIHGILAGTDTSNPAVVAVYGIAFVAVIGLTVQRMLKARTPDDRDSARSQAIDRARQVRSRV